MSSFRNFTAAAKKFAPKNPRERVDAMSNKPCPLHDQSRKRPCKQAKNPLDICQHFQPTRSRCARTRRSVSRLHTPLAARSRPRDRSRSQIHISAQCAARPARPACAVTPRWHGPPAVQGIAYGSVGGPSTFRGVQSTLDGGVITPPSEGMALSATIAAGTSGAVASGAATSGAAASGAAASEAAASGAAASGAAASGAAASGAAASGAQSPRHCRYSTPSSSRDGGVHSPCSSRTSYLIKSHR